MALLLNVDFGPVSATYRSRGFTRPLADTDGEKIAVPAATPKNIFAARFAPKISRITIGFAVATPRVGDAV
jgi:hypothetical protein